MTERTSVLVVVSRPQDWPLDVAGVDVVSARAYLTEERFSTLRRARIFNVCREYSYQSLGYYVSLIAEARGHQPQPDVRTLQDMKTKAVRSVLTEELDGLIQTTLRTVRSETFTLSVYFGKTLAKRDQTLGSRLSQLFRAPLLRADFVRRDRWALTGIGVIPSQAIPEHHRSAVIDAARAHLSRAPRHYRRAQYYLAILHDPTEASPPSDQRALERVIRAARRADIHAELVTRETLQHVGDYDALFIRATTSVDHFTFRLARLAEAEGLAVIDDPLSIIRCTNKVYLAELLRQRGVSVPASWIVHQDNVDEPLTTLGLPLVLKKPDGSFSVGVVKVEDADTYRQAIASMLEDSELVVVQKFIPSEFDWRVGVLDGEPLYACRYHMAKKHWQIVQHTDGGRSRYGRVDSVALDEVPKRVLSTAVRAAKWIGSGLYGVDLKAVGAKVYVIEVNDNPSIESGDEDKILGKAFYDRLIAAFVHRIEAIRARKN